MKQRNILSAALLPLCVIALAGCGYLSIQVEPLPTNTQPVLTPLVITATPSPLASPQPTTTAPVPTLTFIRPTGEPYLAYGTPVKLISVNMFTAKMGWGIGEVEKDLLQHVLFTSDGGQTWEDRTPAEMLANIPTSGLDAVAFFASYDEAWVSFSEHPPFDNPSPLVVWRTKDGGRTWKQSQPFDFNNVQMEFMTPSNLGFLDDQNGWVMVHLGAGMSHDYFAIFTTQNGGETWRRLVDPDNGSDLMACYKSGLAFTSASSGWLTGNCPGLMPKLFVYRSTDGGSEWSEVNLPAPDGKPVDYFSQSEIACGITGINYSSGRSLMLTLRCMNSNNNTTQAWIYSSSNGGTIWNQHPLPVPNNKISMINPSEGFLVGSLKVESTGGGAVYHTPNGGISWELMTSTGWVGAPDFVDSQNGWVIAESDQTSAFVRTINGGKTWFEIKPIIGS